MAKKLLIVWLSLTILIFSSASVYAEEIIRGEFFIKNIVINNEKILNYQADNPFFVYKNLTYIPLDKEMTKILGLSWDMNEESRTLTIKKEDSTQKNFSQRWMKSNLKAVNCKILTDISIVLVPKEKANETDPSLTLEVVNPENQSSNVDALNINDSTDTGNTTTDTNVGNATSDINIVNTVTNSNVDNTNTDSIQQSDDTANADESSANGDASVDPNNSDSQHVGNFAVDTSKYPLLKFGEVIYVPIGMLTEFKEFGIDAYFDTFSGLYITTDGVTQAKSTFNFTESMLNKGLTNYVLRSNGNYNSIQAQNLVFLFKTEARIYNMDPLLLMAVAHKESTFTAAAKSRGGALGMMQVMPSTAARYGFSEAEMLVAHNSVEFGSLYLRERLDAYGGNLTKALSAYNQGSVAVNRGSYSGRYALGVMKKYNQITTYLKTSGYIIAK